MGTGPPQGAEPVDDQAGTPGGRQVRATMKGS
jgi:hypothetical protein